MDAPGTKDAAVLVALHGDPLTAVFTERRADLRRHAGEISFPGGRQDEPDEDLRVTALREAEEEIGLPRTAVTLQGALPPVGTFVTGYRIFPFVGTIERPAELRPQEAEVAQILEFSLRRPGRRPRDEAAGAQGRADQDAHLHGGRPPRLGSDGADRAVAAGAAGAAVCEPHSRCRHQRRSGGVSPRFAQTSFSIGTSTRLPHSVHEPS